MQREIFEVYAKVVDANGTYNTLTGYPKVFDSKSYDDDIEKTKNRAFGAWHECLGAMCKIDTRQLQLAMILRASDGMQIALQVLGKIEDVPDPEPEPEEVAES